MIVLPRYFQVSNFLALPGWLPQMAVHHLPASKQLSGPAIDGICDDLSFDPQVSMAFKMFQYVSILKSSNGTMENWGYHRKAPDGTSVGEVFTTMNQ